MQDELRCHFGRREIFTDYAEVNENNILEVLRDAFEDFRDNAMDCEFLLRYAEGFQPLQRKSPKTYRPDIDFTVVDNVADEVARFHESYIWGIPITLVQRSERLSDKQTDVTGVSLLNNCYSAESLSRKTQELAHFVEVCGIGFTFIDVKSDWSEGDSYFQYEVLDPRYAFVVRSSVHVDHRIVLGATYRKDRQGNRYFTCFTPTRRFEIVNEQIKGKKENWKTGEGHGERNPLGRVPIVEWTRSCDRMGCFEKQVTACDNLNLLLSDLTNQVDQNTQAIWHTNDVEFQEEVTEVSKCDGSVEKTVTAQTPKSNEWVQTFTTRDGKTPFIKPLTLDYDYSGQLNNYLKQRSLILQKCSIPERNANSGGSTGVAMSDATGWTQCETEAQAQQAIMESCKMEEVKIALAAIKINPKVPADSPLLVINYMDVQPNVKRQKTYELTTKINYFATGISHGLHPLHLIKTMNVFDDANQTYEDSKPYITQYLDATFNKQQGGSSSGESYNGYGFYQNPSAGVGEGGMGEKSPNADRISQDNSDQVSNSPRIDNGL